MRRRPVALVFHQEFDRIEDAIAAERQLKGWRREKKEALIRGDFAALPNLASRACDRLATRASAPSTVEPHPSRRNPSGCSSG
ncbi:MAG: GIY-YIG nuclease family protein [Alphaproteobacteria bacterium]